MGSASSSFDPEENIGRRILRGHSNTASINLVVNPQTDLSAYPPARLLGHSNKINVVVAEVHCAHGAQCRYRTMLDQSVTIVGHSNHYTIDVKLCGVQLQDFVLVQGNSNNVQTARAERFQCDCDGDSEGKAGHDAAPRVVAPDETPTDLPPPYDKSVSMLHDGKSEGSVIAHDLR